MLKHAIKFILALFAVSAVCVIQLVLIVAPLLLTIMMHNALWLIVYFASLPLALALWTINSKLKDFLQEGGKNE